MRAHSGDAIAGFFLCRRGFDDAADGVGGEDAGEFEACGAEEGGVFGGGAFLAAGHDEHVEVHELGEGGVVTFGDDDFDEDEFAEGVHGGADVFEDGDGVVVGPVVDDEFHGVEVAGGGDGFEEIAFDGGDAGVEVLNAGDDAGLVEEGAFGGGGF